MKTARFVYLLSYALLCMALFSCSSGDQVAPPVVSMVSPVNQATQVSASAGIQLQFSEPVLNVNSANVTLHEGSATGEQVGMMSVTPGEGNTYTFIPEVTLQFQTTYFVVVGSGITNYEHRPLQATTFSFTTGNFSTPTVTMITPLNGATGVSTHPNIQLLFSKPVLNVDLTTVTLHEGSVDGASIAFAPVTSGDGNIYTFNPIPALQSNTAYFVVTSNGITDASGQPLATTTFSFTTGNLAGPEVSLITPANGATNVNTSARPEIKIEFSKPVVNISGSTVGLYEGSTTGLPVGLEQTTAATDDTYIFRPATDLHSLTTYFVVIGDGITDTEGNALATTTFSFTTGGLASWTRQVGSADDGNTRGLGISVDNRGNSYVTGQTSGGISGQKQNGIDDYFIAKYTASGQLAWANQVGAGNGQTVGTGISVDNAGNSYVTGNTNTGISGQEQTGIADYFIARYDDLGKLQWAKQVGGKGAVTPYYTSGEGVGTDSAGNSYVTGSTSGGISGQTQNGVVDYFIARHDNETGALQWSRQVGVSGGRTHATSISVDSAGNSYVTGDTDKGISGQSQKGESDYFIAKYNKSGELQWARQVGASGGYTRGNSISVDSAGNSYVIGNTNKGISGQQQNGTHDYFVAKYTKSGELQWTKQVGAIDDSTFGYGISVDSAGNSYVTGSTSAGISGQTQNGFTDYFVAKYNASGVLQSAKQVGSIDRITEGRSISVDNAGHVYVTGETSGSLSGQLQQGTGLNYFIAYLFDGL